MVQRAELYEYSSARCHLGLIHDRYLTHTISPERTDVYSKVDVHEEVIKNITHLRETLNQENIFGNDEFVAHMEAVFGRSLRKKKAGRPKKIGV
jgi:hypothetical protein